MRWVDYDFRSIANHHNKRDNISIISCYSVSAFCLFSSYWGSFWGEQFTPVTCQPPEERKLLRKKGLNIKFPHMLSLITHPELTSHSDRSDTRTHTHTRAHPHTVLSCSQPASRQRAHQPPSHPVEGRPISKSQGWHLASDWFCYSSLSIRTPRLFHPDVKTTAWHKNNNETRWKINFLFILE